MFRAHLIAFASLILLLAGCSSDGSHRDLKEFIATVKSKPAGRIDPIPTYPPFENYIYSSASMRSPFDRPIDIKQRVFARANSNVRPDFNRTKEYLEGFDLSSLTMVGTIRWGNSLYAMIKDSSGGVQRVLTGNHLGKNHGKILSIDNTKLELMEIVSDGLDGWVERPRVLALVEKD